jgi:hypothetical protein
MLWGFFTADEITGMEKAHQPVVGAVERTPDKHGDLRRPDQTMARDDTHDVHVVIGKPERRRLGSPTKPGSSCIMTARYSTRPLLLPPLWPKPPRSGDDRDSTVPVLLNATSKPPFDQKPSG